MPISFAIQLPSLSRGFFKDGITYQKDYHNHSSQYYGCNAIVSVRDASRKAKNAWISVQGDMQGIGFI